MSDFSDYPVGAKRDREIAERLCWRMVRDSEGAYHLLNPAGEPEAIYEPRWGLLPTLEEAWEAATRPKPDCGDTDLPRYSKRQDAAWALLMDLPKSYTPRIVRLLEPRGDHIAYVVKAAIIDNDTHEQWEVARDDAADAMSQVWLEWEEAMSLRAQAI